MQLFTALLAVAAIAASVLAKPLTCKPHKSSSPEAYSSPADPSSPTAPATYSSPAGPDPSSPAAPAAYSSPAEPDSSSPAAPAVSSPAVRVAHSHHHDDAPSSSSGDPGDPGDSAPSSTPGDSVPSSTSGDSAPSSTPGDSAPSSSPTAPAHSSGCVDNFHCGEQDGDGTFYGTGLGACGVTNSDTDLIVAVAHELFDTYPGYTGANPNFNPICGKMIQASCKSSKFHQGNTVLVNVTDRCGGCENPESLDFSPRAFKQLADPSVGRIQHMKWHWA
ncbi:RlpA-like double-psi beta-barrel-protein domain-containing protein-containing protein [Lactifluus volemus]|nr:RlpA-like double-psi beta-barrel-protein domain-containing protein-containing protein [Lactifluus volemus]